MQTKIAKLLSQKNTTSGIEKGSKKCKQPVKKFNLKLQNRFEALGCHETFCLKEDIMKPINESVMQVV